MAEIRLNINGREVTGRRGQTILEVARENGIEIPTLCYDERVKIYGSCGLCVVEIEGIPKLFRSCATEISEGMVVKTDTERVRSSRKIALELLLSDHVGDCRPPCRQACPAHTDCQGYVGLIANGRYREAVELIKEQLPLPASIGRVCPHPCEEACRRQLVDEPVSIAWLKRFVGDVDLNTPDPFMPEIEPPTGKSVAVVGGGPCGLTAAYFLAKQGHQVVIYEAMEKPGGMLRYGIPQYRLPKDILDAEIRLIQDMGVEIVTNCRIGKDVTLDFLKDNFDAVFLAIGAWKSSGMRCRGEEMEGVLGGIDFLREVATGGNVNIGSRVAVVGGGNTAMDACRTAVRLGAEKVTVLYRRTRNEMPADEVEIKEAEEEGVEFKFLVQPLEILERNGRAGAIRLQKMKLGEPDASGRRRPEPIPGEEEVIEVDTIIAAIGQKVDPSGLSGITLTKGNTIAADESTFQTSIPGVFAGGDAVNEGPGIAIEAVADGKKAADVINSYLMGNIIPYREPFIVEQEGLTEEDFADREKAYRPEMPHLAPEERKDNFREVVLGYSEQDAKKEAMRCLECGCKDFFECKLIAYANEYDVKPQRFKGEVHHNKYQDDHPFIDRNPDKCILCGLCVRVCEEVMGVTALGLINRGFDTIVKPEFDLPLRETACISCGQCAAVCPTGALQERQLIEKPVPVVTDEKESICSFCSVGCSIRLDTKGDMVLRSLPDKESAVDKGHLCVKGRFGFNISMTGERIRLPMMKVNGEFREVSWNEALLHIAKKTQSIKALNGGDSLALFSSPRYTNEENFLAARFAREGLKTAKIASFGSCCTGGLEDVLGYDASTNTLEELLSTEVIILIGSRIMEDHTIAGLKVRQGVNRGAKLVVINPEESMADELAVKTIRPENNTGFLKQMLKALIDGGFTAGISRASGVEELKASLEGIKAAEEIREIAELYGKAKTAMIVFDRDKLTADAVKLIADIAVVSGHIGSPRRGIIALKAKNNSQGLVDMGITGNAFKILEDMKRGTVKGAFILGEDPAGSGCCGQGIKEALEGLEFLVVQDLFMTETAELAHVVLPAAGFAETSGTFTSTERRIQWLNRALPSISGWENWEVIMAVADACGCRFRYTSVEDILEDIAAAVPEYRGVSKQKLSKTGLFWPCSIDDNHGTPILYTEGFNFDNGRARLAVAGDGPAFCTKVKTDIVENMFEKKLKETGILK